MTASPLLLEFDTIHEMATHLANQVAEIIANTIKKRGCVLMAVSGGRTPECLYNVLSKHNLPWSKVTVVLVDERFVHPRSSYSNESFIRRTLVQNAASKANIIGLWQDGLPLHEAAQQASEIVAGLKTFPDVTILGLGQDGHTASWFPGAEGLSQALFGQDAEVAAIIAKPSDIVGACPERLSLSLPFISHSSKIFLLLAGQEKRSVWNEAVQDSTTMDLPVRELIKRRSDIISAWAPSIL